MVGNTSEYEWVKYKGRKIYIQEIDQYLLPKEIMALPYLGKGVHRNMLMSRIKRLGISQGKFKTVMDCITAPRIDKATFGCKPAPKPQNPEFFEFLKVMQLFPVGSLHKKVR